MKIEKKVMDMSLTGIFTAIIITMSVVPFLGYIPLGFMNATIIHIPVIVGALLLGPRYGAFLGFVFGMTSLIVVAYYVYEWVMKIARGKKGGQTVALWLAGISGAMTNTLLVMNGIYIFFGKSYVAASNKMVERVYDAILAIIVGFGVPEAIVAGILTTAIVKVLFKIKADK